MAPTRKDEAAEGREQPGGGRTANPVYELFVLGELMDSPQYAYRLHRIVNRILGPFHRLSWGTLYPLLRRLEQRGLVTSEEDQQHTVGQQVEGGQHGRRIYHVTEAGRERFFSLMLQPGDYSPDYSDLFMVKLTRFAFLTPAQQLLVLRQYRDYLHSLWEHYAAGRSRVMQNPGITEQERPFILQSADFRLQALKAELTWVDGRVAVLDGQGDQDRHLS